MSSTLATKFGSRESLKVFVRCGLSPCAAQILCTDDGAMPARAAIMRSLQWVASGGFSLSVRFTTCLIFLAVNGLRPGGRVASFNKPSTPLAA
jgi:hypothetical protein